VELFGIREASLNRFISFSVKPFTGLAQSVHPNLLLAVLQNENACISPTWDRLRRLLDLKHNAGNHDDPWFGREVVVFADRHTLFAPRRS
jgi:hypothetical protein